jgi:multicomponent Na+:H+ antiporter subunit B
MIMDVILRVATKLFLPFILMFALYVQWHGDYGPGGGFQAGVIAAAGIILYAIIFGTAEAERAVPRWFAEAMVPLGVLVFAGVGVWSLLMGANYLDYDALFHWPATAEEARHGQHWGVYLVEVGVFVTVSGTMLTIFYNFAGRGRPE